VTDRIKEAAPDYQALADLPENVVGEIIGGELFTAPRPAARHAKATSLLAADIGGNFWSGRGGPGGWIILVEPELHLAGDVLVPDLAGWRIERMPEVPDVAAFEMAPDWVCEVLSPSTALLDRTRKMPVYAREKVRHLWLVDPIARTLEIFRLEDAGWLLVAAHGGDAVLRAEPFEAIELDLGSLWGG
jgi:Uma2 family endonuclease